MSEGGNQDGFCRDCSLPVWWEDSTPSGSPHLVTRDGTRWCFGLHGEHPGMTHYHALPGMAQYIVPSPEGAECHCLAQDGAHVHLIVTPDAELDGLFSEARGLESDLRSAQVQLLVGQAYALGVEHGVNLEKRERQ